MKDNRTLLVILCIIKKQTDSPKVDISEESSNLMSYKPDMNMKINSRCSACIGADVLGCRLNTFQ